MNSIFSKVTTAVTAAPKKRIGITLFRVDEEIEKSLAAVRKYVDVVVVGKKLTGFNSIVVEEKTAGTKLLELWQKGQVNQVIRGQVDDFQFVEAFKKWRGIDAGEKRVDPALLQDARGREFFLTIISNPDAQTYEDKERLTLGSVDFIKTYFSISPRVAVMATCRPGSYGKDPVMSATFDEAEKLVGRLKRDGVEARNINIELEHALPWATLIVPARGTIGNQMFRALVFLGQGKNIASPTYFPGKGVYEDCSRNEKDWLSHFIFASYLAQVKK